MLKKLKSWFLTIFGDIKVFKWPMFIVYDPVLYQLSGVKLRRVLDTLRVGDIVARGYVHYLDGFFIPGIFSHTGIYVGNNTIIHSTAEGVNRVDVLDFLQCDRCAIIRPKCSEESDVIKNAINRAFDYLHTCTPYDFAFTAGDDALYCHEFTASCYKDIKIEKKIARLSGLLRWIRKKEPVYLAASFIENPNFDVVLQIDEKTA